MAPPLIHCSALFMRLYWSLTRLLVLSSTAQLDGKTHPRRPTSKNSQGKMVKALVSNPLTTLCTWQGWKKYLMLNYTNWTFDLVAWGFVPGKENESLTLSRVGASSSLQPPPFLKSPLIFLLLESSPSPTHAHTAENCFTSQRLPQCPSLGKGPVAPLISDNSAWRPRRLNAIHEQTCSYS